MTALYVSEMMIGQRSWWRTEMFMYAKAVRVMPISKNNTPLTYCLALFSMYVLSG